MPTHVVVQIVVDMVVDVWGNTAALLVEGAVVQRILFSGHKLGDPR
jgi:hypothetical protein